MDLEKSKQSLSFPCEFEATVRGETTVGLSCTNLITHESLSSVQTNSIFFLAEALFFSQEGTGIE